MRKDVDVESEELLCEVPRVTASPASCENVNEIVGHE